MIKFEEYTKDPKHTMSEHLRMMSNMIGKLRDVGHALTDEQQVRAVIRSLPASWANMKQILTHSENIKNFSDVSQHIILEAETRDADRTLTYVAQEGSRNANGKRGRQSKKGEASTSVPKEGKMKKRKRGKHGGKKDLSKVKCLNCQQKGHFARDCIEPKKVQQKHVARDREGFVDYHRNPVGSKHIFMGNNSSEEVLGVGSYQLKLRTGRTLILEDVRYAPTVRLNLFSVTALLDSGFVMYGEHPNGGRTEIESRDVDFIESDFPSIGDATGNDMSSIVATKQWMSSTFEMKDMGEANYVLGVKIIRDRPKRLLNLSQETYIKKTSAMLLECLFIAECEISGRHYESDWDEKLRFVKLKPTVFEDGANSDEAEEWISNKEKLFERMQLTPSQKVSLATFYLSEDAGFWWKTIDAKWTADRALNIERTLRFTRAKRAHMSLSRPPVPQWQAGRFPSTSGDRKFLRTDMRSMAYTPRPQTQGFMPRPFITEPRPQPRPGVRPTQYIPPQQQLVQAVSRYCTFCGMTGHTEE
ncbi:hypothetical protein RJ640_029725, partial [Escallonia rubra]